MRFSLRAPCDRHDQREPYPAHGPRDARMARRRVRARRRRCSGRLTALIDALRAADVVVPHTDADGLAAGAIALRERGEPGAAPRLYGRGENPRRGPPPGVPLLLDWGVRAFAGDAVLIDHHVPEAELRVGLSDLESTTA